MMKTFHQFTYFFLRQLKKYLTIISPMKRYRLSNYFAGILYHHTNTRKEQARENISKAFPKWEKEKIEKTLKNNYQFFSYNFFQFMAFPKSWEGLKFDVSGQKLFDSCLKQNKGLILISGHFGAWEILGKWVGEYVNLFTGIAQNQKNKGANKFFIEQRELPGTKHIFRKEPISKMYDVLGKKGVLGLISDQDAKKKGVFVDFFGIPASTSKGAALFHINTSAPILLGVCIRKKMQHYLIKFIPVDTGSKTIEDITQSYTTILEKCVRENPEQYFWFHRRWKTKK